MKWWQPLSLSLALVFAGCVSGVKNTSRKFDTVVIDAGHGGHDSGARARSGMKEKDVALDVALKLEEKLKIAGFKTVMTRREDRFIPLDERARISNRQRNAIFVSVHFNHAPRGVIRGAETYFHHEVATDLARRIEEGLATLTTSRGVHRANFRVLRKAKYPAVLVECGYMSNRTEASRAASAAYRERLAAQIAEGIITQRHGAKPQPAQVAVAVR